MQDLALLIGGAATFLITAGLFWSCLPRGGKLYRFADTEFEPYIACAFCSGIALGFTMVLSGILDLLG